MKCELKKLLVVALLFACLGVKAQVGEYRNVFSVGANGGYVLSKVGFNPTVTQGYHGGMTGGFAWRYTCEKYFKTICSVYGEVNFSQLGWKQDILTANDEPVMNNGVAEEYSRTISYVQIPILAHLAWGREQRGVNFFFEAGPQFGIYLSESTSKNYETANTAERGNTITAQESMPVENKFDYGIAAGLGLEYSHPSVGHFLLSARYYYGLGNLYGASKKDYFGKSNYGNIEIRMAYLFDITKTKK